MKPLAPWLLALTVACGAPSATVTQIASDAPGAFANAYLVVSERGVVVVDSALTVSNAVRVRDAVRATGKPLEAVVLTHGHPDH